VLAFPDELRRRRLAVRHAVAAPHRVADLRAAIEAVVALHSSDPTSVVLSAAARLRSPTVATIEASLYDDRVAVRHHAMRRTIWVMTPEVAQAAHAGFTRKIAAAERRRTAVIFGEDEAWVADGIERVVDTVRSAGRPVGAREVGAAHPDLAVPRVVNPGKPYEGTMTAHTRLLLCAAFEGRVARGRPAGTWIGSQYVWLPSEAWHGIDWTVPDELTGATEVVRRYLDRFGPATVDDIVWWTGATRTLVRTALERLASVEVALDDGSTGHVLDDAGPLETEPLEWVALLPGLDPTAMGWKRRAWYLPPGVAARVTDRNGNIGPTVWADGQVVGGWVQRADGSIAHDADGLTPAGRDLLDAEIERLQQFLGDTRFSVRFPAPNQRDLLA
jgi:hypothetical protein